MQRLHLAGLATLLHAGAPTPASAQSVLWWADYTHGGSTISGALAGSGYSVTGAADAAGFSSALSGGIWDLVIVGLHSGGLYDTQVRGALTTYVGGGGRVI